MVQKSVLRHLITHPSHWAYVVLMGMLGSAVFLTTDTGGQSARTAATSPTTDTGASVVTAIHADTEEVPMHTLATTTPVHVPILVYHGVRETVPSESREVRQFNISPAALTAQLDYLVAHEYTTITFATLADHLTNNTPLPAHPIILSFDDGWRTQATEALPLLTARGLTATFFLYPNVIGHDHYMTWNEVHDLTEAGMEIGSHSTSHQYMTTQSSDALVREIEGSKHTLESTLGVPVNTFAYPFGLTNEDITKRVEHAGYTSARSLATGTLQSAANRYELASYLARNDLRDFVYFVEEVN